MSTDAVNESIAPVFFGQDSRLYGCYHLPADFYDSPTVLICQPTGHEYERCHRAMRQLDVQSARKGLSTLRFDYSSSGDSAGDCEALGLSQMRLDIAEAIKSCCEKTGVQRLSLVGLRLGATLAAQLAASCSEIESLVLYAPVLDGNRLLADWQNDQQAFSSKHSYQLQHSVSGEMLGFSVTEKFQKELSQEFVLGTLSSSLKRVLILTDESELDSAQLNGWIEIFKAQGVAVTVETLEDIAIWRREPMDPIVPIKPIRRIVKWIAEV